MLAALQSPGRLPARPRAGASLGRQASQPCSRRPPLQWRCSAPPISSSAASSSSRGGGGPPDEGPDLPTAPPPGEERPSLQECMDSAACHARLIDGRQLIPLAEAKRFFAAGLHADSVTSGAVERLVLAEARATELDEERAELQAELAVLQGAAQLERQVHEREMRRLFEYAMALEAEVEAAESEMRAVLAEAVHEAEGRVAAQYQRALAEAAAEVENEQALERSMAEQLAEVETALRTARKSQHAWRERALQAERQFEQLKAMIGQRLRQAAEAARHPAAEREQQQEAQRAAAELRREQLAEQEGALQRMRRGSKDTEEESRPAGGQRQQGAGSAEAEHKGPGSAAPPAVPPLNARMRTPDKD